MAIVDQLGHVNDGVLLDQRTDLLLGHGADLAQLALFRRLPCLLQVHLQPAAGQPLVRRDAVVG